MTHSLISVTYFRFGNLVWNQKNKHFQVHYFRKNYHLQVGNSNSALCPNSSHHHHHANYSSLTTHPIVLQSLYAFWIGRVESNEAVIMFYSFCFWMLKLQSPHSLYKPQKGRDILKNLEQLEYFRPMTRHYQLLHWTLIST